MKIAICDDDLNDIEKLRQYIASHSNSHVICEFTSPTPLLKRIFSDEKFDLLFLDVQMPDADGWEIAKELKRQKCDVYIAMITVLGEFIYDCFDRVDWFAPKPLTQKRVFQILDNATEKLYPKVFCFECEHIKVELAVSEIVYLEVRRNNLLINTCRKCFCIRMPLKAALSMLSESKRFVQIHSSYILNLAYYQGLDNSDIVLKTGLRLRITRTYRKGFFKALSEYIRSV